MKTTKLEKYGYKHCYEKVFLYEDNTFKREIIFDKGHVEVHTMFKTCDYTSITHLYLNELEAMCETIHSILNDLKKEEPTWSCNVQ